MKVENFNVLTKVTKSNWLIFVLGISRRNTEFEFEDLLWTNHHLW